LQTGASIHLMWHRNHRYYRRDAKRVVQLVEEYSDPNIGGALGLQGEALVLEGFARSQFVMRNRDAVDGLHRERVPQHKGDPFSGAHSREPAPAP